MSAALRLVFFIFLFGAFSLNVFAQGFDEILDWGELVEVTDPQIEEIPQTPSVIVLDEQEEGEVVYINADGRPGPDARNAILYGSTPASASSGSSGGHITVLVKRLPERVIISANGGDGGDGGKGAAGKPGRSGKNGRNAGFFRSAKSGSDGGNGGNGGDGSHGGHGGSGGFVRIIYIPDPEAGYDSYWENHFEVTVEGGRGGEAGIGGDAGRGGKGGRGGKKFWSRKRKADGRDGLPGRIGRPGVQGMDGEPGHIKFIEADTVQDWLIDEYLGSTLN